MKSLLAASSSLFEALERRWESVVTRKRVATLLISVFLLALAVIEANRRGWLPGGLAEVLPTKHYDAILLAFTLLLLTEVVDLVFSLAQSVSNAVGKQLEIMSLILIRQSFKELTFLDEPIVWHQVTGEVTTRVLYILSDSIGAVAIFALLALYYRLQPHRPISADADDRSNFVASKKLVALALLAGMILLGVDWLAASLSGTPTHGFFEAFYTLLIFADVLIVLISLRYNIAFPVVFRYFGFAVATILVRLALTAPRVIDAGLGIAATLLAIALTWAYSIAAPELSRTADS